MTKDLCLPIALAAKKGVFDLVSMTRNHRLLLTSHGRPVAVVDSAERFDAEIRQMQEATRAVLEAAANLVGERSEAFDLDGVCSMLGIDPERIRERSLARRRDTDYGV